MKSLKLCVMFLCIFSIGCDSVIFRVNVRHGQNIYSVAGNRNHVELQAEVLTPETYIVE